MFAYHQGRKARLRQALSSRSCCMALFVTALPTWGAPLSEFVTISADRLSSQPLLRPTIGWSSFGLFNPAAIRAGPKTILLFRAQDEHQTSRIGYASSTDGLHFEIRGDPV